MILGLLLGFVWGVYQKPIINANMMLQYPADETNIVSRTLIVDQIVGVLRSPQLRYSLDLHSVITVHKNASVNIVLSADSEDSRQSSIDLDKLKNFILADFPLSQFGEVIVSSNKPSKILCVGLGGFLGLLLGLIISLIKTYLKQY